MPAFAARPVIQAGAPTVRCGPRQVRFFPVRRAHPRSDLYGPDEATSRPLACKERKSRPQGRASRWKTMGS
jgi:hypothetical protein